MPDSDDQLSPTGLARLQQATQQRPGYISAADRRLIQEGGVNVGGGYIEINGQALVDEPDQKIPLSDVGKAYLAWRGTDPKLALLEAEQAQARSTQRELVARHAAEQNLQLLQKEYTRGLMSREEYGKLQQQIVQQFGTAKAPSPIDYLSTAEDKDDPIMQETRFKTSLKTTLRTLAGERITPELAGALSDMTTRDKDGVLQNPFASEIIKGIVKERIAAPATNHQQMTRMLDDNDKDYERIENPTPQQTLGYKLKRNRILQQFGQPTDELPQMKTSRNWYTLGLTSSTAPQEVGDMFEAEAQRALQGGDQAPQPTEIFNVPSSGPIRVKTNQDVRRAIVQARNDGKKSIRIIGPDGVTREIPVN
jgi:hypothetical protein